MIDEQQRQVGGRARGRERHRPDAEILNALEAAGVSVGVGGQHHLRTALEHLGAHLLGVAHDQLRLVAALLQRVGAGPDTDEHRLVLLDERLERLEVVFGTGPVGDHHHVAAVDVDVDVGDAHTVDQQRALATDELDGVAGERFQMRDQTGLGIVHEVGDFFVAAFDTVDQPAIAGVHAAAVQADLGAVLDLLEDLGAGAVDERDVVGHQHLGAQVGVAPGDRRRGVDHAGDPGVDQCVGGHAVQIEDVDDDYVARADAAQKAIDVAVDAGGARHSRPCTGVTREKC